MGLFTARGFNRAAERGTEAGIRLALASIQRKLQEDLARASEERFQQELGLRREELAQRRDEAQAGRDFRRDILGIQQGFQAEQAEQGRSLDLLKAMLGVESRREEGAADRASREQTAQAGIASRERISLSDLGLRQKQLEEQRRQFDALSADQKRKNEAQIAKLEGEAKQIQFLREPASAASLEAENAIRTQAGLAPLPEGSTNLDLQQSSQAARTLLDIMLKKEATERSRLKDAMQRADEAARPFRLNSEQVRQRVEGLMHEFSSTMKDDRGEPAIILSPNDPHVVGIMSQAEANAATVKYRILVQEGIDPAEARRIVEAEFGSVRFDEQGKQFVVPTPTSTRTAQDQFGHPTESQETSPLDEELEGTGFLQGLRLLLGGKKL